MIQNLRLLPFLFLFLFFLNNEFTILKSVVLLVLMLFFSKRFFLKFFDPNSVTIFVISAFNGLFLIFFGFGEDNFYPSLLIMPVVLYSAGKWLAYTSRGNVQIVTSFLIIGFALASPAFIGVLSNFLEFGFEGGSRNIVLAGSDVATSATVLGGTLIVLVAAGGLSFSGNREFGMARRFLVFIFFMFSLFIAARLGSRTLITTGAACVLLGAVYNVRKTDKLRWVSFLFFVFFLVIAVFNLTSGLVELDFYFRDRLDSDEYGASTAGGRLERWIGSLFLIPLNPFGWRLDVIGYSHNFWLDIARSGGWLPLFFSIILSISFYSTFKRSLTKNKEDTFFSTFIICLSAGFVLLFFVEPIMDGFHYVFGIFCLFFGILKVKSR